MKLTAKVKARSCNNGSESCGMRFLLILFQEDHKNKTNHNAIDLENNKYTKAYEQRNSKGATISVCAILVFITLLIFILFTLEPTMQEKTLTTRHEKNHAKYPTFALQKMGVLYRRGTKAMHELVIAHVHENVSRNELGLFLRLFYRSSLSLTADLAFIFDSSSKFGHVIKEEHCSFVKLVSYYIELNGTASVGRNLAGFDATMFMKSGKETSEPIWGRKTRSNTTESALLRYGSVVGFEASELDPENLLSGFLEHVPLSLRRWPCYTMLLGRVRRVFKHVMLVDVKNVLVLGDPLTRIRTQSPESVLVMKNVDHGKRNLEKARFDDSVNPGIIMGGTKGVRRFSSVVLTEIVRIEMQYKRKYVMNELEVLNQVVGNEFMFGDRVNLIKLAELVPKASEVLLGSNSKSSGCSLWKFDYPIVQCSSSYDFDFLIRKDICSCEMDSYVYKDCQNNKHDSI